MALAELACISGSQNFALGHPMLVELPLVGSKQRMGGKVRMTVPVPAVLSKHTYAGTPPPLAVGQ